MYHAEECQCGGALWVLDAGVAVIEVDAVVTEDVVSPVLVHSILGEAGQVDRSIARVELVHCLELVSLDWPAECMQVGPAALRNRVL